MPNTATPPPPPHKEKPPEVPNNNHGNPTQPQVVQWVSSQNEWLHHIHALDAFILGELTPGVTYHHVGTRREYHLVHLLSEWPLEPALTPTSTIRDAFRAKVVPMALTTSDFRFKAHVLELLVSVVPYDIAPMCDSLVLLAQSSLLLFSNAVLSPGALQRDPLLRALTTVLHRYGDNPLFAQRFLLPPPSASPPPSSNSGSFSASPTHLPPLSAALSLLRKLGACVGGNLEDPRVGSFAGGLVTCVRLCTSSNSSGSNANGSRGEGIQLLARIGGLPSIMEWLHAIISTPKSSSKSMEENSVSVSYHLPIVRDLLSILKELINNDVESRQSAIARGLPELLTQVIDPLNHGDAVVFTIASSILYHLVPDLSWMAYDDSFKTDCVDTVLRMLIFLHSEMKLHRTSVVLARKSDAEDTSEDDPDADDIETKASLVTLAQSVVVGWELLYRLALCCGSLRIRISSNDKLQAAVAMAFSGLIRYAVMDITSSTFITSATITPRDLPTPRAPASPLGNGVPPDPFLVQTFAQCCDNILRMLDHLLDCFLVDSEAVLNPYSPYFHFAHGTPVAQSASSVVSSPSKQAYSPNLPVPDDPALSMVVHQASVTVMPEEPPVLYPGGKMSPTNKTNPTTSLRARSSTPVATILNQPPPTMGQLGVDQAPVSAAAIQKQQAAHQQEISASDVAAQLDMLSHYAQSVVQVLHYTMGLNLFEIDRQFHIKEELTDRHLLFEHTLMVREALVSGEISADDMIAIYASPPEEFFDKVEKNPPVPTAKVSPEDVLPIDSVDTEDGLYRQYHLSVIVNDVKTAAKMALQIQERTTRYELELEHTLAKLVMETEFREFIERRRLEHAHHHQMIYLYFTHQRWLTSAQVHAFDTEAEHDFSRGLLIEEEEMCRKALGETFHFEGSALPALASFYRVEASERVQIEQLQDHEFVPLALAMISVMEQSQRAGLMYHCAVEVVEFTEAAARDLLECYRDEWYNGTEGWWAIRSERLMTLSAHLVEVEARSRITLETSERSAWLALERKCFVEGAVALHRTVERAALRWLRNNPQVRWWSRLFVLLFLEADHRSILVIAEQESFRDLTKRMDALRQFPVRSRLLSCEESESRNRLQLTEQESLSWSLMQALTFLSHEANASHWLSDLQNHWHQPLELHDPKSNVRIVHQMLCLQFEWQQRTRLIQIEQWARQRICPNFLNARHHLMFSKVWVTRMEELQNREKIERAFLERYWRGMHHDLGLWQFFRQVRIRRKELMETERKARAVLCREPWVQMELLSRQLIEQAEMGRRQRVLTTQHTILQVMHHQGWDRRVILAHWRFGLNLLIDGFQSGYLDQLSAFHAVEMVFEAIPKSLSLYSYGPKAKHPSAVVTTFTISCVVMLETEHHGRSTLLKQEQTQFSWLVLPEMEVRQRLMLLRDEHTQYDQLREEEPRTRFRTLLLSSVRKSHQLPRSLPLDALEKLTPLERLEVKEAQVRQTWMRKYVDLQFGLIEEQETLHRKLLLRSYVGLRGSIGSFEEATRECLVNEALRGLRTLFITHLEKWESMHRLNISREYEFLMLPMVEMSAREFDIVRPYWQKVKRCALMSGSMNVVAAEEWQRRQIEVEAEYERVDLRCQCDGKAAVILEKYEQQKSLDAVKPVDEAPSCPRIVAGQWSPDRVIHAASKKPALIGEFSKLSRRGVVSGYRKQLAALSKLPKRPPSSTSQHTRDAHKDSSPPRPMSAQSYLRKTTLVTGVPVSPVDILCWQSSLSISPATPLDTATSDDQNTPTTKLGCADTLPKRRRSLIAKMDDANLPPDPADDWRQIEAKVCQSISINATTRASLQRMIEQQLQQLVNSPDISDGLEGTPNIQKPGMAPIGGPRRRRMPPLAARSGAQHTVPAEPTPSISSARSPPSRSRVHTLPGTTPNPPLIDGNQTLPTLLNLRTPSETSHIMDGPDLTATTSARGPSSRKQRVTANPPQQAQRLSKLVSGLLEAMEG